MTQTGVSARQPSLEAVNELIEAWRRDRKKRRPMPEELWEAAASLSEKYSLHQISKALGLNHTTLKKRVHPDRAPVQKEQIPTFIELGMQPVPMIAECIIEMEDGAGAKMRMQFRGKTDFNLLELGKAFWRKGI